MNPTTLAELLQLPVFLNTTTLPDSHGTVNPKRPCVAKWNDYRNHKTFAMVKAAISETRPHFGVIVAGNRKGTPLNLLVIDVDVKLGCEVTTEILSFARTYPTYHDASVSGRGLHLYYRLSDEEAEVLRENKRSMWAEDVPGMGKVELFWNNKFVIMTGHAHPALPDLDCGDISLISLDTLSSLFTDLLEAPSANTWPEGDPADEPRSLRDIAPPPTAETPAFQVNEMDVVHAMRVIPSSLNFYALQAVQGLGTKITTEYEWFTAICMALAQFNSILTPAQRTNLESINATPQDMFITWALGHPTPDSLEELAKKWHYNTTSTGQKDNVITYKLLLKLSRLLRPTISMRAYGKTLIPDDRNPSNFVNIVNHYHMKLVDEFNSNDKFFVAPAELFDMLNIDKLLMQDVSHMYVRDIPEYPGFIGFPASEDKIKYILGPFCHTVVGFKVDISEQVYNVLVNQSPSTFETGPILSRRELWQLSKPWDGVDRIQPFRQTVRFLESIPPEMQEFGRSVVEKIVLHMAGLYEGHRQIRKHGLRVTMEPQFMLILKGRPRTYKSAWARDLARWGKNSGYSEITKNNFKNENDLTAIEVGSQVLVFDEIDNNTAEAVLKAFATKVATKNRKMRTNSDTVFHYRTAPVIGTTNKPYVATTDDGDADRKTVVLEISQMDTSLLRSIDMQQLFAQLAQMAKAELLDVVAAEAKGQHKQLSWVISDEEQTLNSQTQKGLRQGTELDGILQEMWQTKYDVNCLVGPRGGLLPLNTLHKGLPNGVKTMSFLDIRTQVLSHMRARNGSLNTVPFKDPALRHALDRLCGVASSTYHSELVLRGHIIRNGTIIIEDRRPGREPTQTTRYIMPPRVETYSDDMASVSMANFGAEEAVNPTSDDTVN